MRRTELRLQTPVAGDSELLLLLCGTVCSATVFSVCSRRQLIIPDPYVIRFAANRSVAMVMVPMVLAGWLVAWLATATTTTGLCRCFSCPPRCSAQSHFYHPLLLSILLASLCGSSINSGILLLECCYSDTPVSAERWSLLPLGRISSIEIIRLLCVCEPRCLLAQMEREGETSKSELDASEAAKSRTKHRRRRRQFSSSSASSVALYQSSHFLSLSTWPLLP